MLGGTHQARLNVRQLPGRSGAELLDGALNGSGPLAHLFDCQASKRMLDDRERQIGYAQGLSFSPPQGNELGGANCHRRHPAFFQFDGVVDTPRRARTSIPNRVENDVALCQVGHDVRCGG